jgi:ATP-binding cassette subfamily B (MDR/TAP) protein 1
MSTVLSTFIVAFTLQWKLTDVTATIIPATVIGVGSTAAIDSKLEDALNATNADGATAAGEILGSIRTVVALRATDRLLSKYKTYLDGVASLGRRRAPILGIQTAIYMFMIYAAYALAFWYRIHLYAKGEVKSSGNVITTPFSIIIGTNAFAQLAGYLGAFMRIFSVGSELLRVIQQDPVKLKNSSAATLHSDERSEDDDKITFASVGFSYPLRPSILVLKDFSLEIPAGKTTALIGPSGSGKSTIVGLLERWYDGNSGNISLGNRNFNDMPLKQLRGKIGLVQQVGYFPPGGEHKKLMKSRSHFSSVGPCRRMFYMVFLRKLPL